MKAPPALDEPTRPTLSLSPIAKRPQRPVMVAGLRRHLSTEEASIYLDCKTRTIFRMVEDGRLTAYRLGNRLKFRKEDLDRALEPVNADTGDLRDYIRQQIRPAAP